MRKKLLVFFLLPLLFSQTIAAQEWVSVFLNDQTSFEQKQQAWNAYFQGKDLSQIRGWKAFKRWEYYYQRRMGQPGDYQKANQVIYDYFLQHNTSVPATNPLAHTTSLNGAWTFIGPSITPSSGGEG
jgi:hypothetical protein